MTTQLRERLDKAWRDTPWYMRPVYLIRTAYYQGTLWFEVMSAILALALIYPAFSDQPFWMLDPLNTRLLLILVFTLSVSHTLLTGMMSRWLRVISALVSSAVWSGCATMLFLMGAFTLGTVFLLVSLGCFVSLIRQLGG